MGVQCLGLHRLNYPPGGNQAVGSCCPGPRELLRIGLFASSILPPCFQASAFFLPSSFPSSLPRAFVHKKWLMEYKRGGHRMASESSVLEARRGLGQHFNLFLSTSLVNPQVWRAGVLWVAWGKDYARIGSPCGLLAHRAQGFSPVGWIFYCPATVIPQATTPSTLPRPSRPWETPNARRVVCENLMLLRGDTNRLPVETLV